MKKIALVTGSSRGLGKSTALNLAKKGVGIIVTYHSSSEEAAQVVSKIESLGTKAVSLQLDTSDTKTFDSFVEQLKQSLQNTWQTEQFDFLVNNAGIGINKPFAETTEEDFDPKGAIEVLTRYLAKELGPRQITVNVVAPGAIETDFGGGAVRDNPEINKLIASQTALGRVGLPDDIGGAIAALLSEENRWVNGQRIEVSGGQNL